MFIEKIHKVRLFCQRKRAFQLYYFHGGFPPEFLLSRPFEVETFKKTTGRITQSYRKVTNTETVELNLGGIPYGVAS